MNEQLETAPQCFQELWEKKREYWTCSERDKPWWSRVFKSRSEPVWRMLFYYSEDAAAYAVGCPSWDGTPPFEVSLNYAMEKIRWQRDLGVEVASWIGGRWVTVNRFPASVPLPEDLRD